MSTLRTLHREYGGIRGLAEAVRAGRLAAGELADASYRRIAEVDGDLHAFTQMFAGVESGSGDGALAGIPIALKDNIDVAGQVTSQGRPLGEHSPAAENADVVDRLRSAGAVIVGKTNLPEYASSAVTVNTHFGTTRNPADVSRTVGGSSGGSAAAVAAETVVAAIGTDTAGSVLMPAALTGIHGFRPTQGRIRLTGVTPLSPTSDAVGLFAWSADDLSALLDVLTPGGSTPVAHSWPDSRIGVLTQLFEQAEPAVRSAVERLLDQLGAIAVPVELPSLQEARSQARVIYLAEVASVYDAVLDPHVTYADSVEQRRTSSVEPAELAAAHAFRERWRAEVGRAFLAADFLVAPTVPITAPALPVDESTAAELTRFTYPFCLAGTPAVSVPCGPAGLMLIASWGGDERLLAATSSNPDFSGRRA